METPTEEVPQLTVGGKFQWSNLPTWGKFVGGAVAGFLMLVHPAWQHWRVGKAETDAKIAEFNAQQAKSKADTGSKESNVGWTLIAPQVNDHEARLHALEVAAARALPRGRAARRPIPVVVAPKPRPLPPTLKAAVVQAETKPAAPTPVPPAAPTPAPPRTSDASP